MPGFNSGGVPYGLVARRRWKDAMGEEYHKDWISTISHIERSAYRRNNRSKILRIAKQKKGGK